MKCKLLLLTILLSMLNGIVYSQAIRPSIKFGQVTSADFQPKAYAPDSQAHAVILFDVGSAKYDIDNSGGFNIVYTFHKRIRLLNKNSFDEAKLEIPVAKYGTREDRIDKL